jgi:holo-[acyl-carrier protein] synthase
MKLLGIGIDIIEINRFKKSLRNKKKSILNRLFTKKEILICGKKKLYINCFTKRFAAKEALVKALGTGFRKNINFKDIEIKNNIYGKPYFSINSKLKNKMSKILGAKKIKVFLSISDEKNYAIANVLILKI